MEALRIIYGVSESRNQQRRKSFERGKIVDGGEPIKVSCDFLWTSSWRVYCLTLFAVSLRPIFMTRVNKQRKMEIIVMCWGEIYNETVCFTSWGNFPWKLLHSLGPRAIEIVIWWLSVTRNHVWHAQKYFVVPIHSENNWKLLFY